MKFNKKGQGTAEYLIIFAVIIVVALVVAGVMGWFPGTSSTISESQSKAYWASSTPLAITDWKITSTNAQFSLQNNSTEKLTFDSITLDGTDLNLTDASVAAGANHNTSVSTAVTCTSGSPYQYDVTITYSVEGGLSGQTFTGAKPVVGTCP